MLRIQRAVTPAMVTATINQDTIKWTSIKLTGSDLNKRADIILWLKLVQIYDTSC